MKNYLEWFQELSRIPHGSGNTKAISDFCARFAADRGLPCRQDEAGNIVIVKAASAGRESDPGIMLQGHLDMVAVTEPGLDFDFLTDPLDLTVEGNFLTARGTTLGGDDGIAVAMALAVLDDDHLSHPRLECVFTTDEEIGMLGAAALDMSDLFSPYLLNMDSEDEGIFVVSCAGGTRARITVPVRRVVRRGTPVHISLTGLTGGHSGTEIDKNRGNAIRIFASLLGGVLADVQLDIVSLSGGNADNAIPFSCKGDFLLTAGTEEQIAAAISREWARICEELGDREPGRNLDWSVTAKDVPRAAVCADRESTSRLCRLISELPDGVYAMSPEMEGLVETSSNIGTITLAEEGYVLVDALRSAVDAKRDALKEVFRGTAEACGAQIDFAADYPGWPYRKDSALQEQMTALYEEMFGKTPRVEGIHGGLECGIFSQKKPDLDIVSIGPQMYDIHSVNERLSLSSCERTWQFLVELLARLG